MTDVHTTKIRSKNMGAIKCSNTQPELIVRKIIHSLGFRFSLKKNIFGKPDLILPKYKKAIFVHGCFWHSHNCNLFKQPKSNISFWKKKFLKNKTRDKIVEKNLSINGWYVIKIWECALKGKKKILINELKNKLYDCIVYRGNNEIKGKSIAIN